MYYIHIHTYIYVCVCVYVCVEENHIRLIQELILRTMPAHNLRRSSEQFIHSILQ